MYHHYVQRRMKLADIAELIKKQYGEDVTPQTLYNWAKKFDLLKYRGKGRKLGANTQKRNPQIKPKAQGMTEIRKKQAAMKERNKIRRKMR